MGALYRSYTPCPMMHLRPQFSAPRAVPAAALCFLTFVVGSTVVGCSGDDLGSVDPSLIYEVNPSELVITIRERGELSASVNEKVVSEVEGRPTLIYLIEEGKRVEKGEKVAELETNELVEKRTQEEIAVARADAAFQQAKKNVDILDRELRSAESAAESQLRIAQLNATKLLGQRRTAAFDVDDPLAGTNAQVIEALKALVEEEVVEDDVAQAPEKDSEANPAKSLETGASEDSPERLGKASIERARRARRPVSPDLAEKALALFESAENLKLQMGEMANLMLQEVAKINLARADLEVTAETLRYSEQLAEEGFMTRGELTRDRIDYQRRIAEMSLAWNNLDLLVNYTLKERKISAAQAVEDASLSLESVRATAEARRVREASDLMSAESEYLVAKGRLATWNEQIEKAVMFAPGPGLVVYGRYDWDEPVYEGMDIRKRQEIVILPDVSWMIAKLLVHEAQIDSVAKGQAATVRVDAFPDRVFAATVTMVSSLPDVRGSWRSDIKVYTVQVDLDDENLDASLRPGMNTTIKIEVGKLTNVLTIPQPALERKKEKYFVWLVTGDGAVAREVHIGANNLTHVEIASGLSAGDRIYLVPPPGAELPEVKEDGGLDKVAPEAEVQASEGVAQVPPAEQTGETAQRSGSTAQQSGDTAQGSQ